MAIVIDGGMRAVDALFYPQQNPVNLQFIQNQMSNVAQNLGNFGKAFFERSSQAAAQIFNVEAMRQLTRQLVRTSKEFFTDGNRVVPLETYEELQLASTVMQRWVMAEPEIRKAYLDQRIDGYSDTYMNVFENKIKDDHYDYRRVMDGVVLDEEDHYVKFYIDELFEGDRELNHDEKVDILSTWDIARHFLHAGLDPTDPFA